MRGRKAWTLYLPHSSTSGTATDQTPAARNKLRARRATTMISVGMNMIASIRSGGPVQRGSTGNERRRSSEQTTSYPLGVNRSSAFNPWKSSTVALGSPA